MHDYPNNAALTSVINAIDANKADKTDIPSIDTTLSAAGAAADAKAVGQAIENIELTPGPKGDSGVYVGASAPTDESVNVWINPNGKAIDMPTGGATDYRLIYQITIDETNQASSFTITEDMDGKPFELTKVFAYADIKGSETGRADGYLVLNNTTGIAWIFNIETADKLYSLEVEIVNEFMAFNYNIGINGTAIAERTWHGAKKINSKISTMRWDNHANLQVPIGSTITIYGC
jgi:hypothetical protein